jgi:sulfur carrier protein
VLVQVNGTPRELPEPISVAELLCALALARERVAVERNGKLVPRTEHERTRLAEGDRVEIVTLVGGG